MQATVAVTGGGELGSPQPHRAKSRLQFTSPKVRSTFGEKT
jgi:hypothetical protein